MTRKDFIELAQILRDHRREKDFDALLEEMMIFSKKRNSRFDRFKFIEAVLKPDA